MPVGRDLRAWVPGWWRGEAAAWVAPLDIALAPVELIFRAAVGVRNAAYSNGLVVRRRAPVPVISVGNVTVGGSGKTPFTAWLAGRIGRELSRSPAIIVSGYGADEIAVHRELNPSLPVLANTRRILAVMEAVRAGADCVVLDDGFQHRSLLRDLDIVLIAAEQWPGRRRMLPRGPWREPLRSLERASQILVTRKSAAKEQAVEIVDSLRESGFAETVGLVRIAPTGLRRMHQGGSATEPFDRLAGQRVVAVTTLADPRPFFDHLRAVGAEVEALEFGDHHEFSNAEIEMIEKRIAHGLGIMTRKEAVKLRGRLRPGVEAFVVEQRVEMEAGEPELIAALRRCFGKD